jgi:hypothetical protein
MSIIGKSQLSKEGFVCLAGPYACPTKKHLIPAVVAACEGDQDQQGRAAEEIAGNGMSTFGSAAKT